MKKRAYQEIFAQALDLFNEDLSRETSVVLLLASGNDLSSDDDEEAWSTAQHIVEQQAIAVMPDDYPNEKLITLMREDPTLLAVEGIGEYGTVREVLIDVVRMQIRRDIFAEVGIRTVPEYEALPAPGM